jgi:2-oxoglutarate dehydrogenase E1 component
MLCYRKFGHNEMDEPSFTQPLMYQRIEGRSSVVELYGQKLIDSGVIGKSGIDEIRSRIKAELEEELKAGKAAAKRPLVSSMAGVWSDYVGGDEATVPDVDTGVPREQLQEICSAMTAVPEGFTPHRKVQRLLDRRAKMGLGEELIDWGMGELLAYGSLLWDGTGVRLSGQDSSRGTFSHRHAVITDVTNGDEHIILGSLHPDQGPVRIYDSPLSEAGVMGFEYGYSLDFPDALVLWEAQFGDFANGAQVIIDQFVTSSEDKWNRLSGLVLLLPHGYEGQGPEHSSARIERFLQCCAEDNIQVVQPSSPAQVFHVLRRQVVRPWRKPLVVLTGKSLLRLPAARSTIDELASGSFRRVIGDSDADPESVRRVVLCSGRVYYDLITARAHRGLGDTAIVRIEQFYPWRPDVLEASLSEYKNAREYVWVQDEPENMGPWYFLQPRLQKLFGHDRVRVACRAASASPATGSGKAHAIEQAKLLRTVFGDSDAE